MAATHNMLRGISSPSTVWSTNASFSIPIMDVALNSSTKQTTLICAAYKPIRNGKQSERKRGESILMKSTAQFEDGLCF